MSAREKVTIGEYIGELAVRLREDVDKILETEEVPPLLTMLMEMSKKQRSMMEMEEGEEVSERMKISMDIDDINRLFPIFTTLGKDEKKSNQCLKRLKNIQLFSDLMLRTN